MEYTIGKLIYKLSLITLAFIMFSCSDDVVEESTPVTADRILKINFGENIRYTYQYFNKYYAMVPQVRRNGVFEDANSGYEITDFNNQIEVRISNGRGSQGSIFLRGNYEGDQFNQIQRFFLNGSTYTYTFEYGNGSMRITLAFDGDGDFNNFEPQIIEFGDYKLDSNGNVIEVLKYRNYEQTPTENDLYERSLFTYDNANNAWQGRMLFFYGWQILPDTRFFSANNVLTQERIKFFDLPSTEFEHSYEYDDFGRTSKAFTEWFPLNSQGFTEEFIYEDN